jgi:tRNA (cytidine56-2'-O)-methyltransferase
MIAVLRLSHRKKRDKRITTHCGLTARAFGAEKIFITGERDERTIQSINEVASKWGGPFEAQYVSNWKTFVLEMKRKGYFVVHLTMYGEPFVRRSKPLRKKKLLVVIGSEKVPPEIYEMADQNLSVGNQPHSEVAALGVFLYEISGIKKSFRDSKLRIIPEKRGKKVIEL